MNKTLAARLKHCASRMMGWEDAALFCNVRPTAEFRKCYLEYTQEAIRRGHNRLDAPAREVGSEPDQDQ